MAWFVYIVRCRDGTLYTGCTNNLAKRLEAHNSGRGARYTRSRRPVEFALVRRVKDRSRALRVEAQLKKLSRVAKLGVIAEWSESRSATPPTASTGHSKSVC
jgi:putative endonuclease